MISGQPRVRVIEDNGSHLGLERIMQFLPFIGISFVSFQYIMSCDCSALYSIKSTVVDDWHLFPYSGFSLWSLNVSAEQQLCFWHQNLTFTVEDLDLWNIFSYQTLWQCRAQLSHFWHPIINNWQSIHRKTWPGNQNMDVTTSMFRSLASAIVCQEYAQFNGWLNNP